MRNILLILFIIPLISFAQFDGQDTLHAVNITASGKLSSKSFIGQQAAAMGVVTTTASNTYYTFTSWRDTIAQNVVNTDSTITISATGSGYYYIFSNMSFTYQASATAHISLFINDVEVVDFAEFERKLGTGNDIGAGSLSTILWLDDSAVLKIKVKGTSVGGTFTVNHGSFGCHRIN